MDEMGRWGNASLPSPWRYGFFFVIHPTPVIIEVTTAEIGCRGVINLQIGFATQQLSAGPQPQLRIVPTCSALCGIESPIHHTETPEIVLLIQGRIGLHLTFQLIDIFSILLQLHFADDRKFEARFDRNRQTSKIELAVQPEYFAEQPGIQEEIGARRHQLIFVYGIILSCEKNLLVAVINQIPVFLLNQKTANGIE